MIVGGSDETRMLLRGLLRLHRHRVLYEGSRADSLARLPEAAGGAVLVLDVNIAEEPWASAISQSLTARPDLRAVLLTPIRGGRVEEDARRLGIHTLLRRPFAVHELIEAVGGPPPEGAPPGPVVPPA